MDVHEGINPWGLSLKPGQVFETREALGHSFYIVVILSEVELDNGHKRGFEYIDYTVRKNHPVIGWSEKFEDTKEIRSNSKGPLGLKELPEEFYQHAVLALNSNILDRQGRNIHPPFTHIKKLKEFDPDLELSRGTIDDLVETPRIIDENYDCMAHTK